MKYYKNQLIYLTKAPDWSFLVLLPDDLETEGDIIGDCYCLSNNDPEIDWESVSNDGSEFGDTHEFEVRLATKDEVEIFIKILPETQSLIQQLNNHYEIY